MAEKKGKGLCVGRKIQVSVSYIKSGLYNYVT